MVPDDWKYAKVTPIHKSVAKSSASSYRPITLTSTTCKLLQHIMSSHLNSFDASHNILHPNQHRFRKALSTTTLLIEIAHVLSESINSHSQTDLVLLYFAKYFYKVPHAKLINKFSDIFKNIRISNWITGYLKDRALFTSAVFAQNVAVKVLPLRLIFYLSCSTLLDTISFTFETALKYDKDRKKGSFQ